MPADLLDKSPAVARGWVEVHPDFAGRLAGATAAGLLDLPGVVVSGHPDRHVVRVELPGWDRALYLKRQHRVTWKERLRQWRGGFGWRSRCGREAELLKQLDAAGLPSPRWVAHGADGRGRAFLLVEELSDAVELRHLLARGFAACGGGCPPQRRSPEPKPPRSAPSPRSTTRGSTPDHRQTRIRRRRRHADRLAIRPPHPGCPRGRPAAGAGGAARLARRPPGDAARAAVLPPVLPPGCRYSVQRLGRQPTCGRRAEAAIRA